MYEAFKDAFKAALGFPKKEKHPEPVAKTPLQYHMAPPSAIPDTHEPSDEAILRAIQQGIANESFENSPTEKAPAIEKSIDDEPPPTQRSPDSHPSVKTYVKKHDPKNDSPDSFVKSVEKK